MSDASSQQDVKNKEKEEVPSIHFAAEEDEGTNESDSGESNSIGVEEDGAAMAKEAVAIICQSDVSVDRDAIVKATKQLRKTLMVDTNSPSFHIVINSGCVPKLLEIARVFASEQDQSTQLLEDILWALTNLASGKAEYAKYLTSVGIIPFAVSFVRNPLNCIRQQATWLIGNIAGNSYIERDLCLEAGALEACLAILQDGSTLSVARTAVWTTSNLLRGKPLPNWYIVSQALPLLARLIYSTDIDIIGDTLWSLLFLSEFNNQLPTIVASGCLTRVAHLLRYGNLAPSPGTTQMTPSVEVNIIVPALRITGNILSGDDETCQYMINQGALESLRALLDHKRVGIRKEALWSLSNVAAGIPTQIQALLDAGAMPPILRACELEQGDAKNEAMWCLINALSGGNVTQILYILDLPGAYERVVEAFRLKSPRAVDMCLDAVDRTLLVGSRVARTNGGVNPCVAAYLAVGIIEAIESLQTPDCQPSIVEKCVALLRAYFADPADEKAPTLKQHDPSKFVFNK